MPAYYKSTVAELRQLCETRGIEHDGLTKTRLIAALREADMRHDYEDAEDARVEGTGDDHKLGLGDASPGNSGSVIDGPSTPSAGRSQQE